MTAGTYLTVIGIVMIGTIIFAASANRALHRKYRAVWERFTAIDATIQPKRYYEADLRRLCDTYLCRTFHVGPDTDHIIADKMADIGYFTALAVQFGEGSTLCAGGYVDTETNRLSNQVELWTDVQYDGLHFVFFRQQNGKICQNHAEAFYVQHRELVVTDTVPYDALVKLLPITPAKPNCPR